MTKNMRFLIALVALVVLGSLFLVHALRTLPEDDASLPKLPGGNTPIRR